MRSILWLSAAAALAVPAARGAAQAALVVPPGFDLQEATSFGNIAGFVGRSRQQILFLGEDLAAMQGRALVALSVRRDHGFGKGYPSANAQLQVRLSHAARPTTDASRAFAQNRGADEVIAFDGFVALPESVAGEPMSWSAPWAVRIPLGSAFVYQQGDLCIEIDGTPSVPPPAYWAIDFVHEAPAGVVTPFGNACGPAAAEIRRTAGAWNRYMVPGATMSLVSFGTPQTPAVMLLGTRLPQGIPLDPIGAPGCSLDVQPMLQVPALYPDPPSGGLATVSFGLLSTDLQLPSKPVLLGANFAVQWANLDPTAGLTTTNALDITLASSLPRGSVTTVISDDVAAPAPFPTSGRVEVSRGPVVLFEYQ